MGPVCALAINPKDIVLLGSQPSGIAKTGRGPRALAWDFSLMNSPAGRAPRRRLERRRCNLGRRLRWDNGEHAREWWRHRYCSCCDREPAPADAHLRQRRSEACRAARDCPARIWLLPSRDALFNEVADATTRPLLPSANSAAARERAGTADEDHRQNRGNTA